MNNTSAQQLTLNEVYDLSLNVSYVHLESFESTIMYQSAFLNFLRLSSYIDEEVNEKINNLYELLNKDIFIQSCITKLKSNSKYLTICKDDSYVFLLLFSYDYFEEFYKCLYELYHTSAISTQTQITFLENIIKDD